MYFITSSLLFHGVRNFLQVGEIVRFTGWGCESRRFPIPSEHVTLPKDRTRPLALVLDRDNVTVTSR